MLYVRENTKNPSVELISDEDAGTLMPEADDEELDKVIDAAIDRVLASI